MKGRRAEAAADCCRSHGRAPLPLAVLSEGPFCTHSTGRRAGPWEAQCVVVDLVGFELSRLYPFLGIHWSLQLRDAPFACDSSPRCPLALRSPCSFLNKSGNTFKNMKASFG